MRSYRVPRVNAGTGPTPHRLLANLPYPRLRHGRRPLGWLGVPAAGGDPGGSGIFLGMPTIRRGRPAACLFASAVTQRDASATASRAALRSLCVNSLLDAGKREFPACFAPGIVTRW